MMFEKFIFLSTFFLISFISFAIPGETQEVDSYCGPVLEYIDRYYYSVNPKAAEGTQVVQSLEIGAFSGIRTVTFDLMVGDVPWGDLTIGANISRDGVTLFEHFQYGRTDQDSEILEHRGSAYLDVLGSTPEEIAEFGEDLVDFERLPIGCYFVVVTKSLGEREHLIKLEGDTLILGRGEYFTVPTTVVPRVK